MLQLPLWQGNQSELLTNRGHSIEGAGLADTDSNVGMAPGRRQYTMRDLVLVAWALAVLDMNLCGRTPGALFPLVWAELGRRAHTAEAAALPRQCLSQIHQARLPAFAP